MATQRTASQQIHLQAMEASENSPALNGCDCPRCDSNNTYDYQLSNNYYHCCVDCERAVAIWVEDDIAEFTGDSLLLIE